MSNNGGGPAGPGRRAVLGSGLAGLAGAVTAAGLAGWSAASAGAQEATPATEALPGADTIAREFRGEHQAGIVERAQAYGVFLGLDLKPGADADAIRRLFTVWTDDIERLMAGRGTLADLEPELAAVPASLTVTLGVGPRLVALAGAEAPTWLKPLPAFSIDKLDPKWAGGDLFLQICADSPTTVAHAQRRMLTNAAPLIDLKWVQRGFREPFESSKLPMRNLFGQVDGIVQPDVQGAEASLLWAGAEAPTWLRGGSSVVVRRMPMDLDSWDRSDPVARDNSIGRRTSDGSVLTSPAGSPIDAPADLSAVDSLGFHVIDDAAHLRRVTATEPHEKILRRPYTYDEAPANGALSDVGLIFVAYQADPVRQFVPLQQRMADSDLLNIWVTPVGSAVYAILPGAKPGEILGEAMLAKA